MLRKLRLQFIGIALLSVTLILSLFIAVFVGIRYVQNDGEIQQALTILSENDGQLPDEEYLQRALANSSLTLTRIQMLEYLSFRVSDDQETETSQTSHLQSPETVNLSRLRSRINLNQSAGTITLGERTYAYRITQQKGQRLIVVLDTTLYVTGENQLLMLSLNMMVVSLIFVGVVVTVFSNRAIRPYVENAENQKRFITNAGHELKTPLAIISANTEMQELLEGETEWSKSTKDQVRRLTSLINQMVTLSKLEEQPDLVLSDCDLSALAQDAAEDFKALITKDGKEFQMEILPDIQVKAEEKSLFELVTILVDNANKYCDDQGKVLVRVRRNRLRRPVLEVSNTYLDGQHIDYSRFFDRFYREDESRNSKVEGFGIGLSMAQSMVRIFKGRISAHYKGDTITFRVTF